MLQGDSQYVAEDASTRAGLRRIFLLIVTVEILTVTALYAFSRHFAQP